MNTKLIFDYKEFKKVIDSLEKNSIKYFVFGGFFIDAINKKETRHEDLDIIVTEDYKMKLINFLKNLGYTNKKVGRLIKFTKKTDNKLYIIGAMFMKEFKSYYKVRGNRSEEIISKDAFEKENYMKSNKINFRTMPFEWFLLYQKIEHFDSSKKNRHKTAINAITPFCKKLKILKQKSIKRLKSDPKYNLK